MHVSLVKPTGSVLSSKVIVNSGIRTVTEYRSIGNTIQVFLMDQVPEYLTLIDPSYFEEWIKLGKNPTKLIKVYRKILSRLGYKPNDEHFSNLVKAITDRWLNAYGPITPLLMDDDVTDIYVDANGVRVSHRDYGLCLVRLSEVKVIRPMRLIPMKLIESTLTIRDLVNRIAINASRRTRTPITAYMPLVSVTDPEYKVRFTVSTMPVSQTSVHVRILPSKPWTLPTLVKLGMLTVNQAALLWKLADEKVPILIGGSMGSGKTSLANAIAMMLKPNMLKVLIMDVDEMNLPGHLSVKLFERRSFGLGVKPITKDELIAHALRMGADYVIVNEVREPEEVKAWLNAVTTGHGGITTFHADDYQQMVRRLTILAPGSEEVLKNIVVVIVGSELIPANVGGNLKVMRRLRYVKDIIVPSEVNEEYLSLKDDLHLRRNVIGSLIDASIDQLLSTIGKLYY
ncbi:type II/IV secretion system ATPase subunit [Caldivirga sp. UBA161]|uniref:type II/IV secretion system ATPase subunit n=1 Tax=Caldivirga sp. UBA161 TaxID=1915569 RepID=UPI0025B84766|nr:ATPase, T2SS/T4P/T4SS family [Caldivirga sp. UBA161]